MSCCSSSCCYSSGGCGGTSCCRYCRALGGFAGRQLLPRSRRPLARRFRPDFAVCGLPAASGIREGGACVGFLAASSLRPSSAAGDPPARATFSVTRRAGGRAGQPARFDSGGGSWPGCVGRIPAKPAGNLRRRAARPVPPPACLARCWPCPVGLRPGGRWAWLGVRAGLCVGLGVWLVVAVGCWRVAVSRVAGGVAVVGSAVVAAGRRCVSGLLLRQH